MKRLWFVVYASLMLGCSGASEQPDAGSTDASASDASATDASTADASATDASTADASATDGGSGCQGPPGLYVLGTPACSTLTADLEAFQPQFPLWSDGARSERFVYLPADTPIDASNPDVWVFPVGTRVYKNLYVGEVRVETRMLEKVSDGSITENWSLLTFAWDEAQLVAEEVSAGRSGVLGTTHDIPSNFDCAHCHHSRERPNGLSAIQLGHEMGGLNLTELNTSGRLSPALAPLDATVPGTEVERAALGYLHGNCGNCHGGSAPAAGQTLRLDVRLGSVEETRTWQTTVGVDSSWRTGTARISPGDPAGSAIIMRMSTRDRGVDQMPPIGSNQVDSVGLEVVRRWIAGLSP